VSTHYFAPPCGPMTEKWVEFNSGATLKKKVMSGVSCKKMTANNSYKIHFLKRMFNKMEDRKTQISSQTTVKILIVYFDS
jgi:hypothetical protein